MVIAMRHYKDGIRKILIRSLAMIPLLFLTGISQSDGEFGTTLPVSHGAGARAMGLGRAYVAIANDPTAIFWNPAGLEVVPKSTFTLFHHQIFSHPQYLLSHQYLPSALNPKEFYPNLRN